MSIVLTSQDISRLVALQETLLSPLDYGTVPLWCIACLRSAEELAEADRSVIMVPLEHEVHYLSESVPPEYLIAFEDRIAGYEPGSLRFADQAVDRAWAARQRDGRRIWNERVLATYLGARLEDFPVYHELIKPAGYGNGAVASVPLPTGEAFLGFSYSRPGLERLPDEDALALMALVAPALEAGVQTLVRLGETRSRLAAAVDELGEALALFGAQGEVLHRSTRLRDVFVADPEHETIVGRMRELVQNVLRLRGLTYLEDPGSPGSQTVETEAARYLLRASLVGPGFLAPHHTVLVSVERLTPELPSRSALIACYDLTPRQAEVALLLARGLTNQEIADRLRISPHTVRHHAEWVFDRVGVRSRKALGLELLERG